MPCSQKSRTDMGREMADTPELSELCRGVGTMPPWHTLNSSKYFSQNECQSLISNRNRPVCT
ncbi:unnamed protein product [Linum tenue]|nr:unnamed protein product [Linum tenue]